MTELSDGLNNYWNRQVSIGNVQAKPFSGYCMFCKNIITQEDEDHSVCNRCWNNIAEEE